MSEATTAIKSELLLGCGSRREKFVYAPGNEAWSNLTTLDMNPAHKPDVLWNLEELPLPFSDNSFDEIHAYEIIEHLGAQGDFKSFFAMFSEIWRILKPGGRFMATVPSFDSPWAWGDPGHKRVITAGTLAFLSQDAYAKQVGKTHMSDYRFCYEADFKTLNTRTEDGIFAFVIEAIKRATPEGDNGHGR